MNLKKMREELGLTQKELAQIIKLDRSSYGRMEQKSKALRVDQLARLIKALKLNAKYYEKLIIESVDDENM
ncbi:helix-turn-helix transcriptional regulator [Mycoplasmatota bacterium WC30]